MSASDSLPSGLTSVDSWVAVKAYSSVASTEPRMAVVLVDDSVACSVVEKVAKLDVKLVVEKVGR